MGNELGFLPGSMSEKLDPWMQPISDNIDFIINGRVDPKKSDIKVIQHIHKDGHKKPKKESKGLSFFDEEKEAGKLSASKELEVLDLLEMGALMHIRGRSIPDQFIIIDEAQNCSIHEIKTIITRAGEGTKIILTGDVSQIDAPYLNYNNNGLTYVSERAKAYDNAAHVTFKKSERSALAEWAAYNL